MVQDLEGLRGLRLNGSRLLRYNAFVFGFSLEVRVVRSLGISNKPSIHLLKSIWFRDGGVP